MTTNINNDKDANVIAFNAATEFLKNMKPPKFLEWWTVENTGWTNGQSWFQIGGTEMNPYRAKTEQEAIEYINREKKSLNDPATKWRYVHVTLEREGNKKVTTEVWTEL